MASPLTTGFLTLLEIVMFCMKVIALDRSHMPIPLELTATEFISLTNNELSALDFDCLHIFTTEGNWEEFKEAVNSF